MKITVNAEENKLHVDRQSHTETQHSYHSSMPKQSGGRTRLSLIVLFLLTMTF